MSSSNLFLAEVMMMTDEIYTCFDFIQRYDTLTLLLVISAALNVALTRGPLPAPSTITIIGFLHIVLSPSSLC